MDMETRNLAMSEILFKSQQSKLLTMKQFKREVKPNYPTLISIGTGWDTPTNKTYRGLRTLIIFKHEWMDGVTAIEWKNNCAMKRGHLHRGQFKLKCFRAT